MTDLHKILTELVDYTRECQRTHTKTRLDLIETAINTAADQIETQQKERVEKLKEVIKNARQRHKERYEWVTETGIGPIQPRNMNYEELFFDLLAALKELEATDDN